MIKSQKNLHLLAFLQVQLQQYRMPLALLSSHTWRIIPIQIEMVEDISLVMFLLQLEQRSQYGHFPHEIYRKTFSTLAKQSQQHCVNMNVSLSLQLSSSQILKLHQNPLCSIMILIALYLSCPQMLMFCAYFLF